MKKISSIEQAFLIKIQALYDIEKQLEKALPKLVKASTDSELKKGLRDHLEETKNHSKRLEEIFSMLNSEPKKLISEGIRGIIEDVNWVAKVEGLSSVKDSMIASSARYAEHYEMAGYMSAILQAELLGMGEAVKLLSQTLEEEENADKSLESAMKKSLNKA